MASNPECDAAHAIFGRDLRAVNVKKRTRHEVSGA